MNLRVWLAFFTLLFIDFGCDKKPRTCAARTYAQPVEFNPTLTMEQEQTLRGQVLDKWLAAAQVLADQSKDQEAAAILEFVRSRHKLCVPRTDGLHCLGPEREDGFALLCLLNTDAGIHSYYHQLSDKAVSGQFIPKNNLLVLHDFEVNNDLRRGVILLHEGRHAYDWQKNRGRLPDSAAFEYRAYALQSRVLNSVGGDKYRALLESYIEIIRQRKIQPGSLHSEFPELLNEPVLLHLLGAEFEQRDLINFVEWFLVDAQLQALAREFGQNARERKLDFLEKYLRAHDF